MLTRSVDINNFVAIAVDGNPAIGGTGIFVFPMFLSYFKVHGFDLEVKINDSADFLQDVKEIKAFATLR